MATEWVKYKLLEFGNGGYIMPSEIFNGGQIWTNGSPDEMILYGQADIVSGVLPEGVIAIVTAEEIADKQSGNQSDALVEYKAQQYSKETDPLFVEAIREKLEGREEKWNDYLEKCQEIYDITEIPHEGV